MADVIKDLKSALKSQEPELAKILEKDFRPELNKNVHILDLSYSTLLSSTYSRVKTSLSKAELTAYDSAYNNLVSVLTEVCAAKTVSGITDPRFKSLFEKIKQIGPILIYSGNRDNVFLVGTQFDTLQSYYSKNIASNPKLKASRFGIATTYTPEKDSKGRIIPDSYNKKQRIRVDFGHLPTEDDQNLTSPLVQKISSVISNTKNSVIKASAEAALRDLYNVQISVVHRFKNTTPEVIEASRNILGSGYVVVTLQNQKLNNKFSAEEGRIYFRLLKSIVNKIDYTNLVGSNSIKQDIAEGIINAMTGSKKKLARHKEHTAVLPITVKAKPKATSYTTNVSDMISGVPSMPVPSVFNLQTILQSRITAQVEKNMGKGTSTSILNYRTGRFADSVTIDRVSISRQGMASVFYNYMRNPYGTFSEGGMQQLPRSRDPKALISRSIREIGASIMYTNMRAILA